MLTTLFRVTGLFALTLGVSSCATFLSPVSGRVVDRTTGAPIEGAYVIRYLEGDGLRSLIVHAGGKDQCVVAGVTRSDATGAYRFPFFATTKIKLKQRTVVLAYKAGYRHKWRAQQMHQTHQPDAALNYLWREEEKEKYPISRDDMEEHPDGNYMGDLRENPPFENRVRYLRESMSRDYACGSESGFYHPSELLYPMYKTMYIEAQTVAHEPSDEKDVLSACYSALAAMDIGYSRICDLRVLEEAERGRKYKQAH